MSLQTLENAASNLAKAASEVTQLLSLIETNNVVKQNVTVDNATIASDIQKDFGKFFDYSRFIEKRYFGNSSALPVGLPVMYLTGDMSKISKQNKVEVHWKYGSEIKGYTEGTCQCKWQGNSSLNVRKKAYALSKMNPAIDMKWGAQKKYHLKAYFTDFSMANNNVAAQIWGDVVRSRTKTDSITTRLKKLVNGGAIDGFPIMLIINNVFQGVYVLNTPKDDWLFGMTKDDTQAAMLSNESGEPYTLLKGIINKENLLKEIGMSIEYVPDEDDIDWLIDSFNTMVNAIITASGTNYRLNLDSLVDVESFIDTFCFHMFTGNGDVVNKNSMMVTYGGGQWFNSPYDLDQCFSGHYQGNLVQNPRGGTTMSGLRGNRMWDLIYTNDKTSLKKRYQELRNNALSESNVYYKFANFLLKIPLDVRIADAFYWYDMPNTGVDPLARAMNYVRLRCDYVDQLFEALS